MSANDISILAGMLICLYIGGEMGYMIGNGKTISAYEASQVLANESRRIRNLLKPQRRYIPYVG